MRPVIACRAMKSSTCMGIVLVGLLAAACGSSSQSASSTSSAADAGLPDDPFAPEPDESAGLTNVGADLSTVLEHGVPASLVSGDQLPR